MSDRDQRYQVGTFWWIEAEQVGWAPRLARSEGESPSRVDGTPPLVRATLWGPNSLHTADVEPDRLRPLVRDDRPDPGTATIELFGASFVRVDLARRILGLDEEREQSGALAVVEQVRRLVGAEHAEDATVDAVRRAIDRAREQAAEEAQRDRAELAALRAIREQAIQLLAFTKPTTEKAKP